MLDPLPWPATSSPPLAVAGRFPLADRGHPTIYRGAAHALHLHGYAGRMWLDGAQVDLQPGDLTLTPAGTPSSYDLQGPGGHWCVHFQPLAATETPVLLPKHLRLGPAAGFAAERFAAVSRHHARSADPLSRAAASVAFQDLLLWCAARACAPAHPSDALADRIGAILDARFAEPFTVGRLAREAGASQHAVARAFRRRFGTTVPNYALQRRMAHARLLLETTDLPVGAIAVRVGVGDAQYFNKLVRRFLGDSPTTIRQLAAASRARRLP